MWKMRDLCVYVCVREQKRERGQEKEKNEEETRALEKERKTRSLCWGLRILDKTRLQTNYCQPVIFCII